MRDMTCTKDARPNWLDGSRCVECRQKYILSQFSTYPFKFKGFFCSFLVKLGDLEGQIHEQDTLAIQKLFLQT